MNSLYPIHHKNIDNETLPLVSIIIPVYNVESYIKECLEQLLHQTCTQIEILCINDGSTDKSPQIIEEYMSQDKRISMITQENQGVSIARATGLAHAQAPYIVFCDPDDYYTVDAIELLYTAVTKYDVDMVSGRIDEITTRSAKPKRISSLPPKEGKVIPSEDDFGLPYYSQCAKLFKASLIKEYAIMFPSELSYGEDLYFTYSYLSISKSIYYIQQPIYFYRKRYGSATNLANDNTKSSLIAIGLVKGAELLLMFAKKHNTLHLYATQLFRLYCRFFRQAVAIMPFPQAIEFYKEAILLWNTLQEYIQYCTDSRIEREILGIKEGYYTHTLMCENDSIRADLYRLYRRSLWFNLNYLRYYILSKLPISKQHHYIRQYRKLKYIKSYRMFSHL